MNIFSTQQVNGNQDYGIKTSVSKNGTTSFKHVFGDEARKINPLHDVNNAQNNLILKAIETNDWSNYHAFEAKQHPAWYEQVNGQYVPNKMYYSSLIESNINAVYEAKLDNDQELAAIWEQNLQEMIQKFNNAPGIVPYVVGLNHRDELAEQYGVAKADKSYFDSKWNSQLVATQGKFEQNTWYENTYFAENQELKEHVAALVSEKLPQSTDVPASPVVASATTENVDAIQTATAPVSESTIAHDEIMGTIDSKTATIDFITEQQESQKIAQDLYFEQVLEEVEKKKEDLQELYLHNLKFAFNPNFKLVKESYL